MEKPIIFSTEMVRAILDGRKTQTRRVIKPQPDFEDWEFIRFANYSNNNKWEPVLCTTEPYSIYKCPYGKSGDTLWVRETWSCIGTEHIKPSEIAPGYTVQYKSDNDPEHWRVEKWRPSIFMPRWASRLTLRVDDVRVERVQDITLDDMIAEGCNLSSWESASLAKLPEERQPFIDLWDSINAKRGYSWDTNPWVWVIEFSVPWAWVIEFSVLN